MSRELKFRVWDKRRNIMEYINDLYWFEENGIHNFNNDNYIFIQNTGLKDKNGKEIYEGDIVRFNTSNDFGIGVVKFEFSGFIIEWTENKSFVDSFTSMFYTQCSSEIEVIGNIFENPELLENKE